MDYQNPQQYANQSTIQESELNPFLTKTFLGLEAQNVFSYVPSHPISHMFPHPNYEVLMQNGLDSYTWPAQGSEFDYTALDPVEALQVQESAQRNAVADHTSNDQGLGLVGPSIEDRFDLLEERNGRLEAVIQDLRSELQEKMRFFVDMEAYIKSLVAWTRESKDAVDSLVADLKKTVELVTSK